MDVIWDPMNFERLYNRFRDAGAAVGHYGYILLHAILSFPAIAYSYGQMALNLFLL